MALNSNSVGTWVYNLRRAQGLTQAELAKKALVSRKWLVEFEKGKPEAQLSKVVDVLGVLGYGLEIEQLP
jgi:HTH-type transcriptional regulator/antitoxin HipB